MIRMIYPNRFMGLRMRYVKIRLSRSYDVPQSPPLRITTPGNPLADNKLNPNIRMKGVALRMRMMGRFQLDVLKTMKMKTMMR
jgi:hypothetical protein